MLVRMHIRSLPSRQTNVVAWLIANETSRKLERSIDIKWFLRGSKEKTKKNASKRSKAECKLFSARVDNVAHIPPTMRACNILSTNIIAVCNQEMGYSLRRQIAKKGNILVNIGY